MSRKDQVDTKNNNKNVQVLKEELWTRKTIVEITMLKRNKTIYNQDILEKIQRNNTREQEVQQALKKNNKLVWEQDGIAYIEGRTYILNNQKLKEWILWENHNDVDISYLE